MGPSTSRKTALVKELLKCFENQCPTKTTTVSANLLIELGPRAEDDFDGKCPYQEAVGSLLWLANMTQPDIANVVRVVACITTTLAKSTVMLCSRSSSSCVVREDAV